MSDSLILVHVAFFLVAFVGFAILAFAASCHASNARYYKDRLDVCYENHRAYVSELQGRIAELDELAECYAEEADELEAANDALALKLEYVAAAFSDIADTALNVAIVLDDEDEDEEESDEDEPVCSECGGTDLHCTFCS